MSHRVVGRAKVPEEVCTPLRSSLLCGNGICCAGTRPFHCALSRAGNQPVQTDAWQTANICTLSTLMWGWSGVLYHRWAVLHCLLILLKSGEHNSRLDQQRTVYVITFIQPFIRLFTYSFVYPPCFHIPFVARCTGISNTVPSVCHLVRLFVPCIKLWSIFCKKVKFSLS
jgi:hypothetical protein